MQFPYAETISNVRLEPRPLLVMGFAESAKPGKTRAQA
jgi:hypothetical protein